MQYNAKTTLLTLSIASIVVTLVVGQMAPVLAQSVPTSSNLVKRDYSYTDDQHLTAGFGNTRVCGDHMCAPGEWTQLQANLNHAQISHPSTNSTKVTPSLPPSVPATPPVTSTNSSVPVSTNSTKPMPSSSAPIPTSPSVSSSVCVAVKSALGNSTVSADVVAKIMSDLGCTQ
ncbi:MAG TPA: hypothetical protein VFX64_06300 [Candidatus Nitrosotalea sp.]|nr:hypothetical protein [Candidatus Nitrosotalea sp.]